MIFNFLVKWWTLEYYHLLSDILLKAPWKHVFSLSGKFSLCLETILNRLSRESYHSGHLYTQDWKLKAGVGGLGLPRVCCLTVARCHGSGDHCPVPSCGHVWASNEMM